MLPDNLVVKLPEWVVPEDVDLGQLRTATTQLVAEFSRPVEQWVFGIERISNPRAWRYVGTDLRDRKQWGSSFTLIPEVYLCTTVSTLKNPEPFKQVLQATIPSDIVWELEDCILENLDRFTVTVPEKRLLRLLWLKNLDGKLNGTE